MEILDYKRITKNNERVIKAGKRISNIKDAQNRVSRARTESNTQT